MVLLLTKYALKLVAASLCLFAALFFAGIGEQRSAGTASENVGLVDFQPLKSVTFRRQLMQNTQIRDDGREQWLLVAELARHAPFDSMPYEMHLIRNSTVRNDAEASKFAKHTLNRNPRSHVARLYQLQFAAETGSLDDVLVEYDRLIQLKAIEPAVLADALIGVFRSAGDWLPLLRYLESQPPTGELLAFKLISEPVAFNALADVISVYPNLRSRFLQHLIKRGLVEWAHTAWLAYPNVSERVDSRLPFNRNFSSIDAPEPFNWKLNPSLAEFHSDGGLFVTHRGDKTVEIAHQLFAVEPGQYVLRTFAEGRMPKRGAGLAWEVACFPKSEKLAELSITLDKVHESEMFETRVAVPSSDCDFLFLQLIGKPSEFPKASRLKISEIELARAND